MKTSTNALTKRYCDMQGIPCETVQSWRGKVRHDLFGIADSYILSQQGTGVWVQNCSYGTLKAHREAIEQNPTLAWVDGSHHTYVQLWEWRKKPVGRKKLWFVRVQRRLGKNGDNDGPRWEEPGEWSGPHDIYPKTTK